MKGKRIDELGLVQPHYSAIEIGGTYFQGNFTTTYKILKKLFGEEVENDGYKVDAHWVVETPAGPASIYNYKDGKNYLGGKGTPKTKIMEWHIGGNNINAYAWVCFAILRS